MRVTRLKIKNFGRHKSIDKDIDVAVLGLLGPNASGKTTILEAIELAFTGKLKDKQDSYVRNWFRPEPEEGKTDPDKPSNGTVEIFFRKDNKDGVLFRQVGKYPKRKLTWDGDTFTSAADIETKLKELFEADKEALSNAIFPPQGTLDKLLFGTLSEREELFTKLLLIGYTSKIVDITDQQCKILLDQVQDYTALHTEVKTQHALAEDDYAQLEGERSRSYDWNNDYQYFRDYRIKIDDFRSLNSRKKQLEMQIETHRSSIKKTVAEIGSALNMPHASLEEVLEVIDSLDRDIDSLGIKVRENARTEDMKSRKERTELRLLTIKDDISKINTFKETATSKETLISELEQSIADQKERTRLLNLLQDKYIPQLESLKAALKKLGTRPAEEEAQQAEKEFKDAERLHILAQGQAEAIHALIEAKSGDTECPVCGSVADKEGHDWILRMKLAEEQQLKTRQEWESCRSECWRLNGALEEYDRRKQQLDIDLKKAEEELWEVQSALDAYPAQDLEELQHNLQQLKAEEQRYRDAQTKIESLQREKETLDSVLNSISPVDMMNILQYKPEEAAVIQQEFDYAKTKRGAVQLRRDDDRVIGLVRSAEQSIEAAHNDIDLLDVRREELYDDIGKMFANLSTNTLNVLQKNNSDQEVTLRDLESKAQNYNEMVGRVEQSKEQANKLRTRLEDVERQIDADRVRQQVVSDLKSLRQAFVRTSIPRSYMQYIFESLTPMAQDNLNMLGADFVVRPAKEDSVTVEFMRLTDDGSGWMPQNKMSGGQKVRVSIAYLLAVQQLIIPDIAFLVLDEPSTHIDDDGIESMNELFTSLGEQLQNTEAQIIICDHKPELQSSFQDAIKLS